MDGSGSVRKKKMRTKKVSYRRKDMDKLTQSAGEEIKVEGQGMKERA